MLSSEVEFNGYEYENGKSIHSRHRPRDRLQRINRLGALCIVKSDPADMNTLPLNRIALQATMIDQYSYIRGMPEPECSARATGGDIGILIFGADLPAY
jgi:hypothetical protein